MRWVLNLVLHAWLWQIRLYKEQAWTVPAEEEEDESDETDTSSGEDDWHKRSRNGTLPKPDINVDDLQCVICRKRFKSAKQWQNHEQSKKHLENIAALKGAFRNDDKQVEMLGKHLGIDFSSEFAKEKKMSAERNDQGLRQGVAGLEQVSVLMMKNFWLLFSQ